MHDGRGIANFILDYADENRIDVTNLSLQKITYFCHVWFLIITGKPLVKHKFEAWEFGPVLPYVYRVFNEFGDQKITSRAKKINLSNGEQVVVKIDVDSDTQELIRKIISFYSRLSSSQLVEESHALEGPWHNVWFHKSKVNPGMQISNELIMDFYSSKQKPYILQ